MTKAIKLRHDKSAERFLKENTAVAALVDEIVDPFYQQDANLPYAYGYQKGHFIFYQAVENEDSVNKTTLKLAVAKFIFQKPEAIKPGVFQVVCGGSTAAIDFSPITKEKLTSGKQQCSSLTRSRNTFFETRIQEAQDFETKHKIFQA